MRFGQRFFDLRTHKIADDDFGGGSFDRSEVGVSGRNNDFGFDGFDYSGSTPAETDQFDFDGFDYSFDNKSDLDFEGFDYGESSYSSERSETVDSKTAEKINSASRVIGGLIGGLTAGPIGSAIGALLGEHVVGPAIAEGGFSFNGSMSSSYSGAEGNRDTGGNSSVSTGTAKSPFSNTNTGGTAVASSELEFQQQLYNDWKAVFGDIQENLRDFYLNLSPSTIAAAGIQAVEIEKARTAKNLQAALAQRGLTGSGLDVKLNTDLELAAAQERAQVRRDAPFKAAQEQTKFLQIGLNQNPSQGVANALATEETRDLQAQQLKANARAAREATIAKVGLELADIFYGS